MTSWFMTMITITWAGVIAEKLLEQCDNVTLVTPAADVSVWTHNTLEQETIEHHLHSLGIAIVEKHELTGIRKNKAVFRHVSSGKPFEGESDTLVMVTARRPQHGLYFELEAATERLRDTGIQKVSRIGDCVAPSTIAAAVYSGHLFAREFGEDIDIDQVPYQRELPEI